MTTRFTKECYYLLHYLMLYLTYKHTHAGVMCLHGCRITAVQPRKCLQRRTKSRERHQASFPASSASSCLMTMTSSLELSSIFSAVQGMAASISTLGSSMPKA